MLKNLFCHKNKKPYSIKSIYYFLLFLMLVFIIAIIITYVKQTISSYKKEINEEEEAVSFKIEQEFNTITEIHSNLLLSFAKEIFKDYRGNYLDSYINNRILSLYNLSKTNLTYSVYWANVEGEVILQRPEKIKNILHRSYYHTARELPWHVHLLSITKDIFDKDNLILSYAIGIEENSKFLGYLILSIKLDSVIFQISKLFDVNKFSFILVDKENGLAISNNNQFNGHELSLDEKQIEDGYRLGNMALPIKRDNFIYSKYLKLKDYPYILIVGVNDEIFLKMFYTQILPKMYIFLGLVIFSIAFALIFKKMILNPISALSNYMTLLTSNSDIKIIPKQFSYEMQNFANGISLIKEYIIKNEKYRKQLESSEQAKEEFMRNIISNFEIPVTKILENINKLLYQNNSENIADPTFFNLLKEIEEAALSIKYRTVNFLEISEFNVVEILEQAIKINYKVLSEKNINSNIDKPKDFIMILGDKLKISQVVVSILHSAISNSPSKNKIDIFIKFKENKKQSFIEICISSKSFVLNETELLRINNILGAKNNSNFEMLDIYCIKKIIKMHQGTYKEDNIKDGIKVIKIILPIFKSAESFISNGNVEKNTTKSNIIYLPNKA